MPKLSIITVNLNNKAGLIDTAKSVVAQTWTDYEWIIIDGGSTDESVDVIKEYAEKTDKLVYWCSEPDGGIYQGMNKGIEKASGEYCWFLNSGDYAYKNTTLEEVFAVEFGEDIVYGDINYIYPEKYKIKYIYSIRNNKNKNPYLIKNWGLNSVIFHSSSIIKKKLFISLGYYNLYYSIAADMEFFFKAIFKYSVRIKYIDIIFSTFCYGGISSNYKNLYIERNKILLEYFPETYEKMILKLYIIKIINFILPFKRIKNIFLRFKMFGVSKTINYYFSSIIKRN